MKEAQEALDLHNEHKKRIAEAEADLAAKIKELDSLQKTHAEAVADARLAGKEPPATPRRITTLETTVASDRAALTSMKERAADLVKRKANELMQACWVTRDKLRAAAAKHREATIKFLKDAAAQASKILGPETVESTLRPLAFERHPGLADHALDLQYRVLGPGANHAERLRILAETDLDALENLIPKTGGE